MIPWELLGREQTPDGGDLALYHRDGEFIIRVDGRELMSSRTSHSEEEMARLAIARLGGRDTPRILIGGLGMGFTLRAALDALPARAEVVVAELVPAVIAWNRGPLAHLAGQPLEDPRVHVEPIDVGQLMKATRVRFDAILLDVDNGPQWMTSKSNQMLYSDVGLNLGRRILRPGGLLAVWSATDDPAFVRRLRKAGYEAETHQVRARGPAGGARHVIFLGRLPAL